MIDAIAEVVIGYIAIGVVFVITSYLYRPPFPHPDSGLIKFPCKNLWKSGLMYAAAVFAVTFFLTIFWLPTMYENMRDRKNPFDIGD